MIKKFTIITILLLVAKTSLADSVIAEGYGYNTYAALISAKRNAVAKVSGEFLESKEVLDYGKTLNEIKVATFGVVKEYEILEQYNEQTRTIKIKAKVDKNAIFLNKAKENAVVSKENITEASNAQQERFEAIKSLYKDLNEIYDVRVENVQIGVKNGNNYVYFLTIIIETKDEWLEKKNKLESVIGKFEHLAFTPICQIIPSSDLMLVDEKNSIRKNTHQLQGGKFQLGKKAIYTQEITIQSPNIIEQFDFELILFKTERGGSCSVATYQ